MREVRGFPPNAQRARVGWGTRECKIDTNCKESPHPMASKSSKKQADPVFTLIPRAKLLALYAGLIECRMFEESQAGRRRTPAPVALGREAPAVALAIDLAAADTLVASPRNPLPALVRTKTRGAASANPRKNAAEKPLSPAAQLKAAVASARQHLRQQKQKIVVVFAADAWTQTAAWRAALQAAAEERLPMIFVAPAAANVAKGAKPGFPSIPVDRDDVVALYRVASESIAHARRGNGATLIECIAWELPASGAGKGAAQPADAIANMERYLAQTGIPASRTKARVMANLRRRTGRATA
jgi:TPP-dependent pyruvate/acetoin dehydrogenase alpha subunit